MKFERKRDLSRSWLICQLKCVYKIKLFSSNSLMFLQIFAVHLFSTRVLPCKHLSNLSDNSVKYWWRVGRVVQHVWWGVYTNKLEFETGAQVKFDHVNPALENFKLNSKSTLIQKNSYSLTCIWVHHYIGIKRMRLNISCATYIVGSAWFLQRL